MDIITPPVRSVFENGKVSDNFYVYEVLKTEHAKFHADQLTWFMANPALHFNAARFAWTIAEPLRAFRKKPTGFTSWGRCPGLNASLPGASKTSLHVSCLGADPDLPASEVEDAYIFLNGLKSVGELILYLNTQGRPKRLHVSTFGPGATGERIIRYPDGKQVAATETLLQRSFT